MSRGYRDEKVPTEQRFAVNTYLYGLVCFQFLRYYREGESDRSLYCLADPNLVPLEFNDPLPIKYDIPLHRLIVPSFHARLQSHGVGVVFRGHCP